MSVDSEQNPFEAPQSSGDVIPEEQGRAPGPIAVLCIVLAASAAAGATFFCTCLGVLSFGGDEGWLLLCIAASFFAFVLFARIGVIIANRLRRTNMVLSWAAIIAGAVVGTGSLFGSVALGSSLLLGFIASASTCTFVIWKLHQKIANRDASHEKENTGFDASG